MAQNRTIGLNQGIPWHIPGELQRFKKVTWGYPIIMGRKTFESIGHALPGRRNIVLTKNQSFSGVNCESAQSLEGSFRMCKKSPKVFILGGEQIFVQAMPVADTIVLSVLDRDFRGDTFFPQIPDCFIRVDIEKITDTESYSVEIYRRKAE